MRNNPEHNSQLLRDGSLKSRKPRLHVCLVALMFCVTEV